MDPVPVTRGRALRTWLERVGFVLLLLFGALSAFAAVSDLAGTARGLPSDHEGTFAALVGHPFARFRATTPGAAGYVTLLERGYALHELTFAVLFLVIIAIPFRRRARWAWWAAWAPTIAAVGYALTFGLHDPAVRVRAVAVGLALPILLVAHAPLFFPLRTGRRAAPSS